jgi:hypothetical protein
LPATKDQPNLNAAQTNHHRIRHDLMDLLMADREADLFSDRPNQKNTETKKTETMAQFTDWCIQTPPQTTALTTAIVMQVHKVWPREQKTRASDNTVYCKQNVLLSDPGDGQDRALYSTFFDGPDLTPEVGAQIRITPGPKGGGMAVKKHWATGKENERILEFGSGATVSIEVAAPGGYQQGPPQQQQPGAPAGHQPQSPSFDKAPQHGDTNYWPPQDEQAQAGDNPGGQEPQVPTQYGSPTQQQQAHLSPPPQQQATRPSSTPAPPSDLAAENASKAIHVLASYSALWPLAWSAATRAYSTINNVHGSAPSFEDIRTLATSMMISVSQSLGAARALDLPHHLEATPQDPPSAQLIAKRAADDQSNLVNTI